MRWSPGDVAHVSAHTWQEADRQVRAAAEPTLRRSRWASAIVLTASAVPVVLLSDGLHRLTNLVWVLAAALLVGSAVGARDARRRRTTALAAIRSAVVPRLVADVSAQDLTILLLAHGVWVGQDYLLAEVGEGDVRIVRPPDPSVDDYPGYDLRLPGPSGGP